MPICINVVCLHCVCQTVSLVGVRPRSRDSGMTQAVVPTELEDRRANTPVSSCQLVMEVRGGSAQREISFIITPVCACSGGGSAGRRVRAAETESEKGLPGFTGRKSSVVVKCVVSRRPVQHPLPLLPLPSPPLRTPSSTAARQRLGTPLRIWPVPF